MRHILRAVFDDHARARQALDALLRAGHPGAKTTLVSIPGSWPARSAGRYRSAWWAGSRDLPAARHVVRSNDHPAGQASGSGPPASHVLTLVTASDAEAQRAASLVPVLIDLAAHDSTPGAACAPPDIAPMHYRRHVCARAMPHGPPDLGQYPDLRTAASTLAARATRPGPMIDAGRSLRKPPGSALPWRAAANLPDDTDVSHTAYRFGRDMHENDRYRNRSWSEANGDLKLRWEESSPDETHWAASALAVHTGWNSISPDIDDDSYRRTHWNSRYASSAMPVSPAAPSDTGGPAPAPAADWKRRHPGQLPPWAAFVDALMHGWSRITIGIAMDEDDERRRRASTRPRRM